jgi:hypothetical protein
MDRKTVAEFRNWNTGHTKSQKTVIKKWDSRFKTFVCSDHLYFTNTGGDGQYQIYLMPSKHQVWNVCDLVLSGMSSGSLKDVIDLSVDLKVDKSYYKPTITLHIDDKEGVLNVLSKLVQLFKKHAILGTNKRPAFSKKITSLIFVTAEVDDVDLEKLE